jgi:hypothetical protein
MPFLDVTDVLLDPMFCETLVVKRRVQTLLKGRTQMQVTVVNPAPVGVVLPLDGELERAPDMQTAPKRIEIHTPYRLRGESNKADDSAEYQPDLINWNGDDYLVTVVDNFSHYGRGFIRAEAVATPLVDNEPV